MTGLFLEFPYAPKGGGIERGKENGGVRMCVSVRKRELKVIQEPWEGKYNGRGESSELTSATKTLS